MTEVNFWQPSGGRGFRVLAPGEPVFFKTTTPHDRVGWWNFFSADAQLRVDEAWESFGEANASGSMQHKRQPKTTSKFRAPDRSC